MIVRFDDIKTDLHGNIEPPTLFLHTMMLDPIRPLSNYYGLQSNFKFNDVSEISFDIDDHFADGDEIIENPAYEDVRGMRVVRMEPFGSFILVNPSISDDGIKKTKSCKAYSLEYELNYKTMPNLEGTYLFYDPAGEAKDTMMDIILECAPNWKVGHIDANVATRYRTFDNGAESVYSFMMNTLQESYSCIFLFDTDNRTINIYDSGTAIENVPLFMSNRNLIENMDVEELSDEIVTCLSVYGADDTSIISVNPLASDKIYNLDYFIELGDIPEEIANKWKAWKLQYELYQSMFSYLFSDYYTAQVIYNAQNTQLTELKNELESMQHIMDTYVTDHTGDHASEIEALKEDMVKKEAEIKEQEAVVNSANERLEKALSSMEEITELVAFTNFFNEEEMKTLNVYIKESSIQDSTYVVSYTADNPALCEKIQSDNAFYIAIEGGNLYRSDEYKDLTEEEIKEYGIKDEQLETILGIQENISASYLGHNFFTIKSGKIIFRNAKNTLSVTGSIVNSTLSVEEKTNDNGNHNCMVTFNIDSPVIEGLEDVGASTALLVVSGEILNFQYNNIINSDNQDTMSFDLVSGILTFTYDSTIYQRQNTIQDLFNYGVDSLNKLAFPSYQFSVDSANFMMLPEFEMYRSQVKLGRSLNVEMQDGFYLQPILIGVSLNFDEPESFGLEFSDKFQSNNPEFLLADMIGKSAQTSASLDASKFSYSAFVNSNIQNDVENLIHNALDVSKQNIINSVNQDVLIDSAGIHLRKLIDKANNRFDPCEVRLINNEIVFTDDAWETAGLAIGKLTVDIDGTERSVMGVVANSLIGNVIIGNKLTIEATGIDHVTGQQNVTHFRVDGSGAFLGNAAFAMQGAPQGGLPGNQMLFDPRYGVVMGDNSLFTFGSSGAEPKFLDENGNVIYDDTGVMPAGSSMFFDIKTGMASFRGDVYADNGYFKGVVEATSGIFKGALDIGDKFKVDEDGNLTCTGADISGSINATDGTFRGTVYAEAGEFIGDITTNNLIVNNNANVQGLEVGKNVVMGPNAKITWNQLPSDVADSGDIGRLEQEIDSLPPPMTEGRVTEITQNGISTGNIVLGGALYDTVDGARSYLIGINVNNNIQVGSPNFRSHTVNNMNLYAPNHIQFFPGGQSASTSDTWTMRVYGGLNLGADIKGTLDVTDAIHTAKIYLISPSAATSGSANIRRVSNTNQLCTVGSSTREVKHDIRLLENPELDASRLYDIEVVQFKYNNDYLLEKDPRYNSDCVGFIAEQVFEVYPIAADMETGKPTNWDERYIIPPMLKLIQDQKKEIDQLRADIEELKGVINEQ